MKSIFIILSLLLTEHGCQKNQIDQDTLAFEYTAVSRGLFKNIKISKETIKIVSERDAEPQVATCTTEIWETLLNLINPIDVEQLPNLKAPSDQRFFDGAAIATLSITYQGKTYKSNSFDHGNPPEAISKLVKLIRSVSENIE